MEWEDAMLLPLALACVLDAMYLLCERISPLRLEGIAGAGIVVGIVTWRANRDGFDQFAIHGLIQC